MELERFTRTLTNTVLLSLVTAAAVLCGGWLPRCPGRRSQWLGQGGARLLTITWSPPTTLHTRTPRRSISTTTQPLQSQLGGGLGPGLSGLELELSF